MDAQNRVERRSVHRHGCESRINKRYLTNSESVCPVVPRISMHEIKKPR
jgi:hypothetical protein